MTDPTSLLAEAALLRVMRRTLPAQRHDVLGALTALKLQLAVARRRASRDGGAMDDDAREHLAQLEAMASQQSAAQAALAELRLWDGVAVQRRALDVVLMQCLSWCLQSAALCGHQLDEARLLHDGAPRPAGDARPPSLVLVPTAHQVVLAFLFHTVDNLPPSSRIVPTLDAASDGWTLLLHWQPRDDGPSPALARPAAAVPSPSASRERPAIDRPMLDALTRHASGADGTWDAGGRGDVQPPSPAWLRFRPG